MARDDVGGNEGFLGRLSEDDRTQLISNLTTKWYAKDEIILAADDESCSLYILLEGHAFATLYSEDGKMVAYRDLAPGDIFGELSAIDTLTRSTFVVARGAVRAGSLSGESVDNLLASSSSFSRQMLLHLTDSVRRMTDRLFETKTLVVRERLIAELIRRARRIDTEADCLALNDLPTHADLAAYIGTHREAVTRELGFLEKAGLIARLNRSLSLLSITAMEAEMRKRLA